jgi:hypothetical protein
VLFGVGIGLSVVLRNFVAQQGASPKLTPKPVQPTITKNVSQESSTAAMPQVSPTPTVLVDPYGSWKTYAVLSGVTKQPVSGVSLKLPSNVLAPVCDGVSCSSQGTYLPGGTRFTVAPRGKGQLLADYRGKIVSDAGGREFVTKPTTVAGKAALEYIGSFVGTTAGGYAFSQMHGVMIEVNEVFSLELNHFSPQGVAADFSQDDTLFTTIVNQLVFNSVAATPIPTKVPPATPTKAATISATVSPTPGL